MSTKLFLSFLLVPSIMVSSEHEFVSTVPSVIRATEYLRGNKIGETPGLYRTGTTRLETTNGIIYIQQSPESPTGYEGEYYQSHGSMQGTQQLLTPELAAELGKKWIKVWPWEQGKKALNC